MNQRRKLHGWRGCGHAPSQDRDYVFEHESGVRVNAGCAVFPDGRVVYSNRWPESTEIDRCVRIQGGRRLRGMMMWAAEKAREK
jgi:hypothetical protein